MQTDELDFDLPPELIAQTPLQDRSDSRLLHYRRDSRVIEHRMFSDLSTLLRRGDLLVFNNSRVIPARFGLRKTTGGWIEGLFLSEPAPGEWLVLLRDLGGASEGTKLTFDADPEIHATLIQSRGKGEYLLRVQDGARHPGNQDFSLAILNRIGRMPLPPYIKRDKHGDSHDEMDRLRYQTVYARDPGSVAAPTAGLHFTQKLLDRLDQNGIESTEITLHVGLGTFKPITAQSLQEHEMHRESFTISKQAADSLNRAKREGRRIVAVGTTSARVLESQAAGKEIAPGTGSTAIFIYPPYQWKHVGALVTNFHLPRSTLIALVAAMTGLEGQRRIYREAIEQRYRFFSYGDAMLIE